VLRNKRLVNPAARELQAIWYRAQQLLDR